MKTSIRTVIAILAISGFSSLFAQSQESDFRFNTPEMIEMRAGGQVEISVDVQIPQDHHIYIDHANAFSFNIVTEFSMDTNEGFMVETKSKPKGVQKDNDIILAGKGRNAKAGTYSLILSEVQGRAKSPKVYTPVVTIRTQLCDTKSNTCFRPQNFKKTLRVRVNEDRVTVNKRALQKDDIKWFTNDATAMEEAKKTGQSILVLFTAPWCGPCVSFSKLVLSDKEVAKYLNANFVNLKFDDSQAGAEAFFNKYSIRSVPSVYIVDANMKRIFPDSGSIRNRGSADSFLREIGRFGQPPRGQSLSQTTQQGQNPSANIPTSNPPSAVVIPPPGPNLIELNIHGQGGGRVFLSSGAWYLQVGSGGSLIKMDEHRRDENYAIVLNSANSEWMAVPVKRPSKMWVYRNATWQEYANTN